MRLGRPTVSLSSGTGHGDFEDLDSERGVVARIVTGPHDAHRQDPPLSRRDDTGRPRAVIRLRIAQPRTPSLPCPDEGQTRTVTHEMKALAGRDRPQTAPQMLTAPRARRIVGNGEVETHDPEQRVQEPFGLAQREMGDKPQGQSGLDGEIRGPPRPTPPAAPPGRPGSDRFRGHPHRHIAAANEGLVIGRPVRHAVLRLIRGMNLRLHPGSVAPAEARRTGQTAPPAEGLHATTPRFGVLCKLSSPAQLLADISRINRGDYWPCLFHDPITVGGTELAKPVLPAV